MQITVEQFQQLFTHNKAADAWVAALNAILPKYGIDTPQRVACFLAQCGHESEGFTCLVENLNYSAQALATTWPNRYSVDPKAPVKAPNTLATQLHRRPEAIANNVYANRLGNGDEASGDGWQHRGRGVIQITGKDAYKAFAKAAGIPYDQVFAYLETKHGAVESACWYWSTRDLNPVADADNYLLVTKRINGGTNGFADRSERLAAAKAIFLV
jgi:putative chitinase